MLICPYPGTILRHCYFDLSQLGLPGCTELGHEDIEMCPHTLQLLLLATFAQVTFGRSQLAPGAFARRCSTSKRGTGASTRRPYCNYLTSGFQCLGNSH